MTAPIVLVKRATPFALAFGIWFTPVPAGLTAPAWHLFAVFVAAIVSVLLGAFPLLTSTMLAVARGGAHRHHRAGAGVRAASPTRACCSW